MDQEVKMDAGGIEDIGARPRRAGMSGPDLGRQTPVTKSRFHGEGVFYFSGPSRQGWTMPYHRVRLPQLIVFITAFLAAGCRGGSGTDSFLDGRERECTDHLREIASALQAYRSVYGSYPPPHLVDAKGTPTHSWRALIVRFTDYGWQCGKYNFNEPWDGPNNREVTENRGNFRSSRAFACPNATLKAGDASTADRDYGLDLQTNYVMIEYNGRSRYEADDDGGKAFQKGVVIVEMKNTGIFWAEPRDVDSRIMEDEAKAGVRPTISSDDPHGAIILYSDGTMRRVKIKGAGW